MRLMKVLLSFLTTTVIGGLLVSVPVALLVLILDDVLAMVVELVAPVVDLLPTERLGGDGVASSRSVAS